MPTLKGCKQLVKELFLKHFLPLLPAFPPLRFSSERPAFYRLPTPRQLVFLRSFFKPLKQTDEH
jgi:hypothetical protein